MKVLAVIIVLAMAIQQAATVYVGWAVAVVRAMEHGDAVIPCGSSKIFLDGEYAFVSWVKNDSRVVYRFPTNDSNKDETSFNEICYLSADMKACRDRTSLFIPDVTKDDTGFYRCRIHYNASPIVDFDHILTIVDKPGYPKVYTNNREVFNDFVGPVALGSNVTLVCEVEDKNEQCVVHWEHNGQRLTGSELVKPGLHRAVLNLPNIERDQNDAKYVCVAQPADVTVPLTKEVEIKMFLPPRSIKIDLNENYHFESGIPRAIDCVIKGFVPTPTIEWYLGDTKLKADTHQEIPKHDVVISTLTLVVKQTDNNRLLSCQAGNKHFGEVFSNNVRIQVGIKPKCVVKAKHIIEIKPNSIEKATCVVDSDPPPTSFTWTFPNNKTVETPVQETDIPTRFKTVLSWIPEIDDIGKLKCTATNYYGEQEEPCKFDFGQPDCTDEMGAKVLCKKGLGDTYRIEKRTDKKWVAVETKKTETTPWWILTMLLVIGTLFPVGIIIYSVVSFFRQQYRDYVHNYEDVINYYTRRHRSSSFLGTASFHREPTVTEEVGDISISITPAVVLGQTLGACDHEETICCHESYYV